VTSAPTFVPRPDTRSRLRDGLGLWNILLESGQWFLRQPIRKGLKIRVFTYARHRQASDVYHFATLAFLGRHATVGRVHNLLISLMVHRRYRT
jgi:hypothetical protein